MRSYGNSDVKALLSKFGDHRTCWKVGLSLGSMLYFEMGKKCFAKLQDGSPVEIGSITLVLEADEWTISKRGSPIISANLVTEADADNPIPKYFIGESLEAIRFSPESKECFVSFSDAVEIHLKGEAEDDICTITFPDGTIVTCNSKNGFYSGGSRSEPHAAAYSHEYTNN